MESPAKKKILDALAEATRHFAWNDLSGLSAQGLAECFGVSRNLVSQYLNEAQGEGTVIKINTRPAYFLNKAALCERTKAKIWNPLTIRWRNSCGRQRHGRRRLCLSASWSGTRKV